MKRYATALFFCTLALSSQLAHADIIDDAIGNIQQAINDAYNPGSSRSDDDDGRYDDGRYDDGSYQGSRQQRRDNQQQYNDRQRQLVEFIGESRMATRRVLSGLPERCFCAIYSPARSQKINPVQRPGFVFA